MLRRIRNLFRTLFGRGGWEQELDQELREHVELRAADLMRSGLSKEDAQRRARIELGSREKYKEEVRAASGVRLFDEFSQDFRYALRVLRQSPVFTMVAIGSLALGIGMNTALFSVVNTLLLKELPYKDADRLVYVTEYWPHEPMVAGPPNPDFENWLEHVKLADGIAAYGGGANALVLTGMGEPEQIQGTVVTSGLLDLIGTNLAAGRNFTAQEDSPGGAPTVILGYGLWLRKFGGSPDVIGKTIELSGEARTIVGVLPASFEFPDNNFRHDLLAPMRLASEVNWRDGRDFRLLRVLARRKPGVSLGALKSELTSIVRATAPLEPPQMVTMRKDMEIRLMPLRDWLTGKVRTMVLVLQGAVAMILLIACLNIASLQVARAISRRKEIAVRAAIGASAARLVRQLMTESLLVCVLAGAGGLALGYFSMGALRKFLPENLHLADTVHLDATVLLYTLVITIAAAIVTGVVPAVAALRVGLHDSLKEEGRSTTSRHQHRIRGGLVIAEIAAAMTLLVGSSLLIRTFLRLASEGLGFEPRGVLTLRVAPSQRKYRDDAKKTALYERILENARAIPGVETVAMAGGLPIYGAGGWAGISYQGKPEPPLGGRASIPVSNVSTDYFRALGIPLLRGRLIAESDLQPAARVAVVNQAFAREFYPGEDALGKRIEVGSRNGSWREIVGIVGNVKVQGHGPTDPFMIYVPMDESARPEMFLVLKSSLPLSSLVGAATKAVHDADADQPVFDVATMEERLSQSLSTPRANMTLMGVFAALALILAIVGIFGAVAYFVNSRMQEIAIRMALGASGNSVAAMILRYGMAFAAAGITAGIFGALALTRSVASLVEGIAAYDPLSFIAAAALFAFVAAIACFVPARRAARVDPMAALRHG